MDHFLNYTPLQPGMHRTYRTNNLQHAGSFVAMPWFNAMYFPLLHNYERFVEQAWVSSMVAGDESN
jgi:hypothetical protein